MKVETWKGEQWRGRRLLGAVLRPWGRHGFGEHQDLGNTTTASGLSFLICQLGGKPHLALWIPMWQALPNPCLRLGPHRGDSGPAALPRPSSPGDPPVLSNDSQASLGVAVHRQGPGRASGAERAELGRCLPLPAVNAHASANASRVSELSTPLAPCPSHPPGDSFTVWTAG